MRRTSYYDKASYMVQKSQNRRKHQLDRDQLDFKLQVTKFNSTNKYDEMYNSSRTNRYSYMYKQPMKSTAAYNRPYTTQRSSSLNQIQKLSHDGKKQIQSFSKSHKQGKDLWVGKIKDFSKQKVSVDYSKARSVEPMSKQKGKIHRGTSLKGDDRSFPREYSFDCKKYHNQSNTPARQIKQSLYCPSNQKRYGVIDLIGKNLNKSLGPKQSDDFFQYVMRFCYKTMKGYSPSNPNKINQDSYITSPNMNKKTWEHLFGICDGHGPLGHLVSNYVKVNLAQFISSLKNMQKNPALSLARAFQSTYQKLLRQSQIDMSFSGSTVIACYFLQNKLYCCNVGDSRAIIGRNKASNQWQSIALSTDHKPSIPLQAQRIRRMKGRIQAYKDQFGQQIGPLRVWLRKDNVPGLAMSRSFGDLVAASVGVSHQPQIKQFSLSQQDKIIVIASDGVFQFLTNEEIIKAMVPYYQKNQIQQASDHLLQMAHRSWSRNSSIIDDITFVLIFMAYDQV